MRTIKNTCKKYHLLSVLIGILPLLLLRVGVAQATPVAHQKAWKVVSSPNVGTSDQLLGIAAISTKDVWAVGDYINSSNIQQTLIEQWNGASWSIFASPNVGSSDNVLYGVTAVSSTDIWAVGEVGNPGNGPTQTLIEHWDGTKWSVISSPNPGFSASLYGVTAVSASNVLAVGYYVNKHNQALIEQWNGTSWSVVPSPAPGSYSGLNGVARVPGTKHLWAVGYYAPSNVSQTLTEFYG